ncbi:MAG TPA: ATP synthase subunit C [Candidatus Brocadiia bacterium]|nr:ATP synthase subunit C [Candidatus Brocadiia bacterium]
MGNRAKTVVRVLMWTLIVFNLAGVVTAQVVFAQEGEAIAAHAGEATKSANWQIAWAAAAVTGLACVAAGYAVGKVGSAAMGAVAERPELMGRAILFVGLAEGIAIYGLLVAILLMQSM